MSKIDAMAFAAMISFAVTSSAVAQGPSEHLDQPLGAEDRLGGVPEGQSGKGVGLPGTDQPSRTEGFGGQTSYGDGKKIDDHGGAH